MYVVRAERRHLERNVAFHDEDDAEGGADADRAAKELPHGLGRRGRGDVVVGGRTTEQTVAHAAAGEVRLEAGGDEPPRDVASDLLLRVHWRRT
jgi:hypothetical protein